MRNGRYAATLFLCLVLTCLDGMSMAGLNEETMVVDNKRVYLVKPGDTLAGIAASLMGEAGRWKDIWKNNPQIKNPDLIFPGDVIVIGEAQPAAALGTGKEPVEKPAETAAVPPGPPAEAPPEAPAEVPAEMTAAAPAAPAPLPTIAPEELMEALREQPESFPIMRPVSFGESPAISPALYETCGLIMTELPEAAVIGSTEKKRVMSKFDVVFINRGDRQGLIVGQEWRILRPVRKVHHPVSGAYMGWLIKVVGRLRTDCLQENTATATIVAGYDSVSVGDRLEPYNAPDLPGDRYLSPKLSGPCPPAVKGSQAIIVAGKEDKILFGEGDILYLDKGLAGGITPGTRFAVVREGLTGNGRGIFLAGELQILNSQGFSSTALVTNSLYPITAKDRLVAW